MKALLDLAWPEGLHEGLSEPVPECGAEIQTDSGEVAGEVEFVWQDQRVAIWVSADRAPQHAMLAAQGWRLFSLEEVEELPRLLEVALTQTTD